MTPEERDRLDDFAEEMSEKVEQAKKLADGRDITLVVERLERGVESLVAAIERIDESIRYLQTRVASLEMNRG